MVSLQAIVNVPYDSLANVNWTGLINPNCSDCLTQLVSPIITTTYTITITDFHGCVDTDDMTLFLEKNAGIYVPNIFSPNSDQINDLLVIGTGSGVSEIISFIIFDRWGNQVFNADHFTPGSFNLSWDGRTRETWSIRAFLLID